MRQDAMTRISSQWPSVLSRVSAQRPATSWTCQQCSRRSQQASIRRQPFYTTRSSPSQAGKRAWRTRIPIDGLHIPPQHRKVAITAAVLFVLGSAGLAFSERVRHFYIGAERSGRVGVTLAVCVNDYRKTLKKSEDPNYDSLLSACHARCAQRTLEAMEKNGSIFIKLGQHLSSLNYLLPEEWCSTFIPLQDKCPVSAFSDVNEMVRHDTGRGLDDYFTDFERRPIGAASLAQVHIACMKDTGERVAVKVQHPSLDDWSRLDLALTSFVFRTLKRFFPEYDLTWLSDEMEQSLPKELDFREEGRNAERTKEYFSRIPNSPLVIPSVKWARRRILVMEYITGHRPDDLEFLDANGISRDEVSAALARVFNEMIFGTYAPLHCDPHGGNLAIRLNPNKRKPRNFDIILYDHGLYRDIPLKLRRSYAHLWLATLDVDEPKMRKYAYEVAGIGDDEFPIFASAITGRDFSVVQRNEVASRRNKDEKRAISDALGSGDLVEQLVQLLGKVPRVILLILKTNDLTRSLDENLQTREGPVRSFMILARYAARAVYEEEVEGLPGGVWGSPKSFVLYIAALGRYARVAVKLRVYELYLGVRRRLGMNDSVLGGDVF